MEKDNKLRVEKFYTSEDYIAKRFDTISRQLRFSADSVEEFMLWKNTLRNELKYLTGINSHLSCGLNAQIIEKEKLDGYFREKILLETEPGVIMPLYALIPDDLKKGEKRPVVLALHGHCGGGKSVTAGRYDIPEVVEAIKVFNYDYGVQLVKQGFMVFCPDARGSGERREKYHQNDTKDAYFGNSCYNLHFMAVPLGQTIAGMMAWDNMRLIDYIEIRDDCDVDKIGCAGLSGGGQQTMWLTALDERIKCAVISGYFYGAKNALLQQSQNCICNIVPHLWEKADMGDIGALIAPRPLLIETGDKDGLNGDQGMSNVYSQVEITKKAYELFSSTEKLYHHVFNAGHVWSGEKAIPWLKKWLMGV